MHENIESRAATIPYFQYGIYFHNSQSQNIVKKKIIITMSQSPKWRLQMAPFVQPTVQIPKTLHLPS